MARLFKHGVLQLLVGLIIQSPWCIAILQDVPHQRFRVDNPHGHDLKELLIPRVQGMSDEPLQ
eukprot:15737153-Heterocapsa_arctica.AAC.1